MTAGNVKHVTHTEPEFVTVRSFDAPRKRVFDAWTKPELMAKWWGPKGFTVSHSKMDLKPGGIYHYGLKSSDGQVIWGKLTYREIMAPEKLVFVTSFSDEKGGTTRHPMSPNWPLEMLSMITFEEEAGKTKIIVRWSPLNPTDIERQTFIDGMTDMEQGWTGTLDQFADYLAKA